MPTTVSSPPVPHQPITANDAPAAADAALPPKPGKDPRSVELAPKIAPGSAAAAERNYGNEVLQGNLPR